MEDTDQKKYSYAALLERPTLPQDENLHRTLFENDPDATPSTTIASLVAEREAYITAVDRAVKRLKQVIKRLSEERAAAAEEIALCHEAISSPVRRLPSELLVEIFQFAINTYDILETIWQVGEPAGRPTQRTAFLLTVLTPTHVCRAWRAAAHGEPRLWADILLCDMQAYNQRAVSNVAAWMQRAAPLPVNFTVSGAVGLVDLWRERYDEGGPPSTVFDHETSFPTRRIRTLRLRLPASDMRFLSEPKAFVLEYAFPALELLHIAVKHGDAFASQQGPIALFASSPLRQVYIHQPTGIDCNLLSLPWHSLTRLTLNTLRGPIDKFWAILRQCTALVRASLHFGHDMLWDIQDARDPIILPYLHTLDMGFYVNAFALRQPFHLPSLTSFSLRHEFDFDGDDFSGALAAILAHAPRLTKFEMQGCNAECLNLAAALRLLPEVETFRVSHGRLALDSFARLLQVQAGAPPLLPRLRHLDLVTDDASSVSAFLRQKQVYKMIVSRRVRDGDPLVACLETLNYWVQECRLSDWDRNQLLALRNEGFQVSVH
ncbi:hypothetical protein HDZ31DRAFT_66289 [Schizophyllum fasciatum]